MATSSNIVSYLNYGPWQTNSMTENSHTVCMLAKITSGKGRAQTTLINGL